MNRQKFPAKMSQRKLTPEPPSDSAASLLIPPDVSPYRVSGTYQPNMKILAIGIDEFGACVTRLLASSTQNVCCCELATHTTEPGHVQSGLDKAIKQSNLLFVLTDGTQPSSVPALSACLETAVAVGIQVIIITPGTTSDQPPCHIAESVLSYCTVPDPFTACNLIRMMADLAKIDDINFNYDGYVEPILQSGRNRHFVSYQAAGAERGSVAGRGVLTKLQQQTSVERDYSGALACIYCNAKSYYHDFDQAIVELFRFFLPNSTNAFNIIYNYVIDEKLVDEVRVAVLVIT